MLTHDDLRKNLNGIAIGVRFSRNFAIADNLGKITDFILYSKDSFFNASFFPLVNSGVNEKYLTDEVETRYLAINTSDIIIEVNKLNDFKISVTDIENAYEKTILKKVFDIYKVREIQRIGYLSKYFFNDKELAESFLKKTGVDTNNISLRFQKNYPLPNSMFKKEVDDYCSNIYTIIKKPDSNELLVISDFQVYFKPFLDDKDDIQYRNFIKERETFNTTKLLEWLNDYLVKK